MNKEEEEKIKLAGRINSKVRGEIRGEIKKEMPLIKIAELIEEKIKKLGAKPAFPINLSINEIAAHYTPSFNDKTLAQGLLKVDFGCHIDGFISDSAFSIDLENSKENSKLIESAIKARDNAIKKTTLNSPLKEIGKAVEDSANSSDLTTIRNLSGHSIDQYEVHSGITIPNFNNSSELELPEGLYAIETFITEKNALGLVRDGGESGIYKLENQQQLRDSTSRKIMEFILQEYKTLPFCSRWIYKKFGLRALISLKQMVKSEILHSFPQLIEKSTKKVAQAEHTILLTEKEKSITTL